MKKMSITALGLLLWVQLPLVAQDWKIGGNGLSSNGKLGATNDFSMIFITKNTERGRLTNYGYWGIGTTAPNAKVQINGAAGQTPLKVQVNNVSKLIVHKDAGGVSIGSDTPGPSKGLLVEGNTGIGGNPGSYKFKITHGTFGFNIENTTTKDNWEFWSNSGGLSIYANSNFRGNFDKNTGVYTAISDERSKTNIRQMPTVLEKVMQLKPATYQFKTSSPERTDTQPDYGFVAQEVEKVFPHLVTHLVDQERGIDTYTMDYSGFGVLAIKAIQELQQTVSALQRRIAELEADSGHPLQGMGNTGIWLEKNRPNPFSQNTLIGYQTPDQAGQISIVITDLQGGEIQRFEHLQAGQGQVEITAGSIPAGIYIYSLYVDGRPVDAQRMLLKR